MPKQSVFEDPLLKLLGLVSLASFMAAFLVRQPTLVPEVTIPGIGLKLGINAGHLLVFGPVLIACALVVLLLTFPGQRDISPGASRVATLLLIVCVISSAFLCLQFFLLLAPAGECNTFSRVQLLLDTTLKEFQPEYCMGLPGEVQAQMPWLIRPPIVQAWCQIALVVIAAVLSWTLWKRFRPIDRF